MRRGEGRQAGFADAFLADKAGANRRLERIAGLLDWAALAALVDGLRPGRTGRPPYAPLAMTRALLLAQWYGLSDPELADALADRLSFRRFCGFSLDEPTPDDTTLCRFRAALTEAGLAAAVFAEVDRQLDAQGFVLKRGSILDATVVAADASPSNRRADGAPVDAEARWTTRGGRSVLGYKAHVGVDLGTGLVRSAILTPASVHDSRAAASLVRGDEAAVYADRAYDSEALRTELARRGIDDAIMHRARRNNRQPDWQRAMNRALAPLRAGVERVFGTWKRSWGYRRVRYRGLVRNQAQLHLLAAAWNLLRAANLRHA